MPVWKRSIVCRWVKKTDLGRKIKLDETFFSSSRSRIDEWAIPLCSRRFIARDSHAGRH